MSRFLMRDEEGNTCPKCGGSGMWQPHGSLSPSDADPCPCTYPDEDDDDQEQSA